MTAHKLMRKAQITSCPELSDSSITEKRLTRLKRPPLRLLDSDITDIEDSNINTRPPAKIPTLPSPPRTMEPRRNSSETPEPSQTCGGLDSLPRAGFCESGWTASGNGSWTDTQRQNYDFNSNGQNCTSNNNFQLNVLMKLDKVIAKQEEHSLLLRRLLQTREEDTGPENPIPSIGQLPDLLSFEDKLRVDEELQKKQHVACPVVSRSYLCPPTLEAYYLILLRLVLCPVLPVPATHHSLSPDCLHGFDLCLATGFCACPFTGFVYLYWTVYQPSRLRSPVRRVLQSRVGLISR
ncbi:hypothetical protein G5714_012311 [Onychostoma macrolepis]|uniref:Uncharacterized protein n=1 Tax=Onychostoma macrolepis TaxID=369639 RepID=A0A7J6CGQ4_9TELE|nr:hypothetical protein G5714_012311 [Onychostoma macrolepis]